MQRVHYSGNSLVVSSIFLLLFFASVTAAFSQDTPAEKKYKIYVAQLQDEVNPSMTRTVKSVLRRATDEEASLIIFEINTFGGLLDDADEIRQAILNHPKPVWAFINKNAASAGALISIACDSIYMAGGASMGAATVVDQQGTPATDKYQSYMRSIMRSTASQNGREPRIAEAMVDERVDLDSLKPEGKILTLTTEEAIAIDYCEGKFESVEAILSHYEAQDYALIKYTPSTIDQVISWFLNPFISSLLILVIIGGIYFELQTPGVGFPLAAAITALVLYFVPYYLSGLAENWELIVFFIGIGLLAAEIFVIPGFGVAGVGGLVAIFGSLGLMMLGNEGFNFEGIPTSKLYTSLFVTTAGLFGGGALLFIFAPRLIKSKAFRRLTLQNTLDTKDGYSSVGENDILLIGKTGTAYTVLRPSGKVLIEDKIYDATSIHSFIEAQMPIVVVSQEGSVVKVKVVDNLPVETA